MTRIVRRNSVGKVPKSLEQEVMEITEEMAKRPPLDFQSYQQEVMKLTLPWPIETRHDALRKIAFSVNVMRDEENKEELVIHMANILRAVAELADFIPVSLERVANISISHEMPRMRAIEPNNQKKPLQLQ